MSGRGTTVVAWVIGLGALAAQAVVPVAASMLENRAPTPVEVTAPALPAVQKAGTAVVEEEGCEGFHIPAQVIALIG